MTISNPVPILEIAQSIFAGFRGVLKNVDLSNDRKIHHTNIDDRPKLQNQVVRNILRFLAGSGRG